MTPRKSGREGRTRELLELWMGSAEDRPAPSRRVSPSVLASGVGLAAIVTIGLARYAVDVLLIGLALLGIGLALHTLSTWLAESDLLSPGWFTILVLAIAVGAWALFYPAEGLESLGRYIPKPVVEFLEWSESKGWGQRLLIGPGDGGSGPTRIGPASAGPPSSPPSRSVAPPAAGTPATVITVTASATSLREGQAVVLTARVSGASATGGVVTFYDGPRALGEVPVAAGDRARVASLTVTLSRGLHRITASLGLAGPRSEALEIRVTR